MAFTPPSYETIRDGILRDIRSQLPDADIGSDSDNFIRSAAVAAAIEGLYQHQAWVYRQIFPDTSDETELLHHAANRGLQQKAAVAATGIVSVTGTQGITLPLGATLKHVASATVLVSTAAATLDALGTALVPVIAQTTGAAMNALSGAVLVTSPPLGIDAMASLSTATTGGADIESADALLVRLLELLRNPPAGGASYDYKRWAKEVDGVADATVLPKRRGPDTIDVVVTGANGAPSDQVIATCAAYIDNLRPVTAEVFVYAPLIRTVNATANIELVSGYTLADVQKVAQTAYSEELSTLAPGALLKRSRIGTVLGNLAGVADYSLLTPTTNVTATDVPGAVGWIRPGTLTLGLMS